MYKESTIGVVIPCFNEEKLIASVIESMPKFVDKIYLVDDCSIDRTVEIVTDLLPSSPVDITVIQHESNQGVGGAIASGYMAARQDDMDAVAVMAGDGQMDPSELESLLEPVISGQTDYAKGNRLFSGDAWNIIPRVRYIGNSILSLLTKIASGYWHVADSQSGYTVIGRKALHQIDWTRMYKRYGQPNDLLVRLNIYSFRVKDIPIQPIYNIGEQSGIKPIRIIPKMALLIIKLFFYRMFHKYVIRDFHPLVFFYLFATLVLPAGLIFGFYLTAYRLIVGPIADTSALFAAFLTLSGFQFLFFGMWMDMESNKHLR